MASHTYLTTPSSNLQLCSRSWCWMQHSWLMSTGSHLVSADLTNPIMPAPCRLASAQLRIDITSSDTGSPLSASSRTRSLSHQTSQSSHSLLPMSLLLLLLRKALAAFEESSCCFWPKFFAATFNQSSCCDFWPKLLLRLLTKALAGAFDQSSCCGFWPKLLLLL